MTALRIIGKQRLLTGMRDKNYTDAALMIKKDIQNHAPEWFSK